MAMMALFCCLRGARGSSVSAFGSHKRLRKRVIRVEDSEMFSRYIMKRDKIRMNRVDKTRKTLEIDARNRMGIALRPCEAPDPPFFTSEWLEWHKENDVLCPMDNEINEVGRCRVGAVS